MKQSPSGRPPESQERGTKHTELWKAELPGTGLEEHRDAELEVGLRDLGCAPRSSLLPSLPHGAPSTAQTPLAGAQLLFFGFPAPKTWTQPQNSKPSRIPAPLPLRALFPALPCSSQGDLFSPGTTAEPLQVQSWPTPA